ncbi:MAG: cysteine synthase family protein [Nanoarchaeota archaeon]|nr:cysteine synthase family protein [Nanoarchaeota archaeon]
MIGNIDEPTPMVNVGPRFNPSPDFSLYVKLERVNPLGSIKDRVALSMIQHLDIKEGQTLVEPSSGNTGLALAALCNSLGIPVEIAVPERVPEEKKMLLRLLGVQELWEADDNLCPVYPNEGARGLVNGLVTSPAYAGKYVSPNQYENEWNVMAHYMGTGPEIWKQTEGKINYFFAGFGTGGTLTGVGRYLKEQNPDIKIIAIEPTRPDHNLPGMKRITGLPAQYVPKILDKSLVDEVIPVEDDAAYHTGIELARKTGILVGPTTGAILYAAREIAKINSGLGVVISPDDAFKYLGNYAKYL